MIGKISGRVDYVAEDHVLIEAAGVGYVIYCTQPTLLSLPSAGEPAALYTELVVREDLLQLFGFRTRAEREWHRLLTSVQGVGAKVSLAILAALGTAGVSRALATGDAVAIRAAPGVGPKLATRIVTELRGKAPDIMALSASMAEPAMATSNAGGEAGKAAIPVGDGPGEQDSPASAAPKMAAAPGPEGSEKAMGDALSALINLGYERGEAAAAVAGASTGSDTAEELIRAALKSLAREL